MESRDRRLTSFVIQEEEVEKYMVRESRSPEINLPFESRIDRGSHNYNFCLTNRNFAQKAL